MPVRLTTTIPSHTPTISTSCTSHRSGTMLPPQTWLYSTPCYKTLWAVGSTTRRLQRTSTRTTTDSTTCTAMAPRTKSIPKGKSTFSFGKEDWPSATNGGGNLNLIYSDRLFDRCHLERACQIMFWSQDSFKFLSTSKFHEPTKLIRSKLYFVRHDSS